MTLIENFFYFKLIAFKLSNYLLKDYDKVKLVSNTFLFKLEFLYSEISSIYARED